jgi:hypothetical protein
MEYPAPLTQYRRDALGYFFVYNERVGRLDYQANARRDSVAAKLDVQEIKTGKTTWLLGAGYVFTDDGAICLWQLTVQRAGCLCKSRLTRWPLLRFVTLNNHQLPQSALKSKPPMRAMKDWYASHPHLFVKRP